MSRSTVLSVGSLPSSRRLTPYNLRGSAGFRTPYQTRATKFSKGVSSEVEPPNSKSASSGRLPKMGPKKMSRSSTVSIPDAIRSFKEIDHPKHREQYIPNPQLPGVGRLKFPDGAEYALLVVGKSAFHPIMKIADTSAASFTVPQLLGIQLNGSTNEDLSSNMVQCIAGSADGSIHIVKCGMEFLCVGNHFLARYVKDVAAWVLQAVTNGEDSSRLYEVQHPSGQLICLQLFFGISLAVHDVRLEDQNTLKMERAGKTVLDLFEPRGLTLADAVLRLYLSIAGNRLFALTNRGIYELEEAVDDVGGFQLQMSLSPSKQFTEKTHRILASGIMKSF